MFANILDFSSSHFWKYCSICPISISLQEQPPPPPPTVQEILAVLVLCQEEPKLYCSLVFHKIAQNLKMSGCCWKFPVVALGVGIWTNWALLFSQFPEKVRGEKPALSIGVMFALFYYFIFIAFTFSFKHEKNRLSPEPFYRNLGVKMLTISPYIRKVSKSSSEGGNTFGLIIWSYLHASTNYILKLFPSFVYLVCSRTHEAIFFIWEKCPHASADCRWWLMMNWLFSKNYTQSRICTY